MDKVNQKLVSGIFQAEKNGRKFGNKSEAERERNPSNMGNKWLEEI